MDEPVEVTWHAMPVDEVAKRLATSTEKGLDATEASARLQEYGDKSAYKINRLMDRFYLTDEYHPSESIR